MPGHRRLRSAMTTEYDIPRSRTQLGDSFLCCLTARVERSSRRYKKHHRLVILQTSHYIKLYSPLGQHRQKTIIKYNKINVLMI